MSKVAVGLVVLLLVHPAPLFCSVSSRSMVEKLSSVEGFRRHLSDTNEKGTISVNLMHIEHVDSPYKQPNLTLMQRAQNAAKGSKQRLRYFSEKISGTKFRTKFNHLE
ncbi:unnamed protein product [Calypogeia fissa]